MNKKQIRNKTGIFLIASFLVITLVSWVSVETLSKSHLKKINKTLAQIWGEQSELKNFSIPDSSAQKFKQAGVLGVFKVIHTSTNYQGYAVLARARSKFEDFEYVVFYDQNKTIKAVRVILYREDYGGEIGSKRWLQQFVGKTAQSPIKIDDDIQGISGATISYRAITFGVKDITNLISNL